jgi:hypothetical protein
MTQNQTNTKKIFEHLGISKNASIAEIKKAFKKISVGGAHPDKGGDENNFKLISNAYQEALKIASNPLLNTKDSDYSDYSDDSTNDSDRMSLETQTDRMSKAFKKIFNEAYDNFVPMSFNLDRGSKELKIDSAKITSKKIEDNNSYTEWIKIINTDIIDKKYMIELKESVDICEVRGDELLDQNAYSKAYSYFLHTKSLQKIKVCLAEIHKTIQKHDESFINLIKHTIEKLSLDFDSKNSKKSKTCHTDDFVTTMHNMICDNLLKDTSDSMMSCILIKDCSKVFKINKSLEEKCEKKMSDIISKKLHELCYIEKTDNFVDTLIMMFKYVPGCTESIVQKVFPKSNDDSTSNLPRHYKYKLAMCNAFVKISKGDIRSASLLLKTALTIHPVDESHDDVLRIYVDNLDMFLNECSDTRTNTKLNDKTELFKHDLKYVPMFRFYEYYEKTCMNKPLSLDRIWSFIDFAGSAESLSVMIECFIRSLYEIINYIESDSVKDTITKQTLYGLFCVAKEILTVIGINEVKHPSISSSTFVSDRVLWIYDKLCDLIKPLIIKNSSIGAFENIHSAIYENSNNIIRRYRKLTPLHCSDANVLTSVHDRVYESIILTEFTVNILKYCQNNNTQIIDPVLAKYYLMEGCVNGWNDDDFTKLRFSTMVSMLSIRKQNVEMIEALMCVPFIPRDKDGFLECGQLIFDKSIKQYSNINGFSYDKKTGELLLITSQTGDKLFTSRDIQDTFSGIHEGFFTLDQPDGFHEKHPYQHMKFYPKNLKNTDTLATMLIADCMLKYICAGKEASGIIPFDIKDVSQGFMKDFSENIQKDLSPIHKTKNHTSNTNTAHRFWVDAGELECEKIENDSKITYIFGEMKMTIKKHLLEKDDEGIYKDTDDQKTSIVTFEEVEKIKKQMDESAEAIFAKNFTKHFEEISKKLPVFARLKELCKLQGIMKLLINIKTEIDSKILDKNINAHVGKIESILLEIKSGLTYPNATPHNESTIFEKHMSMLREQGFYPVCTDTNVSKHLQNHLSKLRSEGKYPIYTETNVTKTLQSQLNFLSSKGVYPIYSESKVAAGLNDTLAKNGVSRNQVIPSEISRVETSIRSHLQTEDSKLVAELTVKIRTELKDEDTKFIPESTSSIRKQLQEIDLKTMSDAKQSISSAMRKKDADTKTELSNFVKQYCGVASNVDHVVNGILGDGLKNGIVRGQIKEIISTKNKAQYETFYKMMNNNKITINNINDDNDIKSQDSKSQDSKLKDFGSCSWVPAVFCTDNNTSRIYGGVNMCYNFVERKLDNDIRKAVNSSGGFLASQTGKYSFEKTEFNGDKTIYDVRTTYDYNTWGCGWKERVSYVRTRTEKTSYVPFINSINNDLYRFGMISHSDLISFRSPISNSTSLSNPTPLMTPIQPDINVKVIRRNLENIPFRVSHVAHSAILITESDKHHLLEIMADGKAHLNKDIKINIEQFTTSSDYKINGTDWRGQTTGIDLPQALELSPGKLQEMMQKTFDEGGEYNLNLLSSKYNTCHTAQEKLIKELTEMIKKLKE